MEKTPREKMSLREKIDDGMKVTAERILEQYGDERTKIAAEIMEDFGRHFYVDIGLERTPGAKETVMNTSGILLNTAEYFKYVLSISSKRIQNNSKGSESASNPH